MIVSIMQPGYIPWLGFFELMRRVDVFVIYNDVDYDSGSWRNRNRIRTQQGSCWLTVPVQSRGKHGQKIMEVAIDNRHSWAEKHCKSLHHNYRKAPYFDRIMPFFDQVYAQEWDLLHALDMRIIMFFKDLFGISTRLIFASDLHGQGQKTERLVSLCRELHTTTYISANGARDYLQTEQFDQAGIKVEFQNYEHPTYPQQYDGFVSHLSVVDLAFNCGERSFDILMSGSTSPYRVSL